MEANDGGIWQERRLLPLPLTPNRKMPQVLCIGSPGVVGACRLHIPARPFTELLQQRWPRPDT